MVSALVYVKTRLPFFIFMVLCCGGASVAKSSGIFLHEIRFAEHFVGGHQYLHLIIATTLSFLAVWVTMPEAKKFIFKTVGWPTLGLLALVVTDELLQYYLPNRHYSLIDLSINAGGIVFGVFIYIFVSLIVEKIRKVSA